MNINASSSKEKLGPDDFRSFQAINDAMIQFGDLMSERLSSRK